MKNEENNLENLPALPQVISITALGLDLVSLLPGNISMVLEGF